MTRKPTILRHTLTAAALTFGLSACSTQPASPPESPAATPETPTSTSETTPKTPEPTSETVPETPASTQEIPVPAAEAAPKTDSSVSPEEWEKQFEQKVEARRESWKGKTFEEFEKQVYREPFENGKYIVNGDTPIRTKDELRDFFVTMVQGDTNEFRLQDETATNSLIVGSTGGQIWKWGNTEKYQLTYCVSPKFGNHYGKVVKAMKKATKAWQEAADIRFRYVDAQDANCDAANTHVLFDVSPVDVQGQYVARAFFPGEPRPGRNVLIDNTSFQLNPNGNLTLAGILRHELGHVLGFRHEHTRPEAGKCFEDKDWTTVTNYDAFSVMHYPQCNGQGDWSLNLTKLDKNGAACVYGPAVGFRIKPNACQSLATALTDLAPPSKPKRKKR
jgi:serine protease